MDTTKLKVRERIGIAIVKYMMHQGAMIKIPTPLTKEILSIIEEEGFVKIVEDQEFTSSVYECIRNYPSEVHNEVIATGWVKVEKK